MKRHRLFDFPSYQITLSLLGDREQTILASSSPISTPSLENEMMPIEGHAMQMVTDNLLESLPEEIVLEILLFLGPRDLATMSCVNTTFYYLTRNNQLWKQICKQSFSLEEFEASDTSLPAVLDWKQCYREMSNLMWHYQIGVDEGNVNELSNNGKTASILRCGNTIFVARKPLSPKKSYRWQIQIRWKNEIWHRTIGVTAFRYASRRIPPLSIWIGNQNSYWGKSWGFATKGATESLTYHNGLAMRYSPRPPFKNGDIVGIRFEKGNLSFEVNGVDYGIAFREINNMVYPAVHLYDDGDTASIMSFETLS